MVRLKVCMEYSSSLPTCGEISCTVTTMTPNPVPQSANAPRCPHIDKTMTHCTIRPLVWRPCWSTSCEVWWLKIDFPFKGTKGDFARQSQVLMGDAGFFESRWFLYLLVARSNRSKVRSRMSVPRGDVANLRPVRNRSIGYFFTPSKGNSNASLKTR